MIKAVTPNKILALIIFAPIFYYLLTFFVSGKDLRDVFNSLSFGTALTIWVTWLWAFIEAVRHGGREGKWRLILGLCLTMQTVMVSRAYSALFNYYGRPESWSEGPFPGFMSFSYFLAGVLILSATAEEKDTPFISYLPLLVGVGIGGIAAGVMIGMGISSTL